MKMEGDEIRGECRRALGVLILCLLSIGRTVEAARAFGAGRRQLMKLVEEPQTILTYYNGPLLSGPDPIPVYIIWYGEFSDSQRAIVRDFLASFSPSAEQLEYPSVRSWWNMTAGYVDSKGLGVAPYVNLAGELSDTYSLGKSLTESDVEHLVLNSTSTTGGGSFPSKASAAYFVITSADVEVETFCMNACGSHDSTFPSNITAGQQLPFAWVGNSASQCPGLCAWPFAKAQYGPPLQLTPPNGDVGMDGVIINLAALLAGMATNPFNTGYYQGDALAPLEAATACTGIYGPGAYPGDPGMLFVNPATNASFNAVGIVGREFLLPALWLPSNRTCTPPVS